MVMGELSLAVGGGKVGRGHEGALTCVYRCQGALRTIPPFKMLPRQVFLASPGKGRGNTLVSAPSFSLPDRKRRMRSIPHCSLHPFPIVVSSGMPPPPLQTLLILVLAY